MANPTTNYNFVLPTASDLVTDLPADFDIALQGVDTRLKALQPGTTLGDLAYSSATANTNTRLAIGSAGQVLTVASGVPSWATPTSTSGLTKITNATFTAVTSVSLPASTFTSTYKNYKIIFNVTAAAGAINETRLRMRASGADNTTANYYSGGTEVNYAGGASTSTTNGGTYVLWGNITTSSAQNTQFEITMMSPQASSTTVFNVNGGKGTWTWKAMTGYFEGTTSFDSMSFYADAGTITGTYVVYGLQN